MKGYVLSSFGLFSAQTANSFGCIARYAPSLVDAPNPKRVSKTDKANL